VTTGTRWLKRGPKGSPPVFEDDDPVIEDDNTAGPGLLAPEVMPNGSYGPRFRRYTPAVAPPPPSAEYQQDAGYADHSDFHGDTLRQARTNHRAWGERHGQATNAVCDWLGRAGLLGPEAQAARQTLDRVGPARSLARQRLAEAQARLAQAETDLAELVRRVVEAGGDLPSGGPVLSARLEVEAGQLVAELVDGLQAPTHQAWGRCLGRADWKAALRGAERRDGSEAAEATAWLRPKVTPPAGPDRDPYRWL
jgi:hypothetical protein